MLSIFLIQSLMPRANAEDANRILTCQQLLRHLNRNLTISNLKLLGQETDFLKHFTDNI